MNRILHFCSAILIGMHAGLATADDTDIYLGDTTATEGVILPNVLFVLDTSSSMNNTDGTGVTRLDRMKSAMTQIIESSNNVKMGMMRFHREGGPVLYPVSNIHAAVTEVEPENPESDISVSISSSSDDAEEATGGVVNLDSATLEMINKPDDSGTGSLNIDVAGGNDDAEEYVSSGTMYRSSSDLEMMHESPGSSSSLQTIGMRFRDLAIPSGSTLSSSRIRVQLDETKGVSDSLSINIYGQLALDPGEFSSSDYDISSRTKTSAVVNWQPESDVSVGDYLYTPSLSSIITEIMAQDGWSSGNDVVFVFEYVSGSGVRAVESYNGSKAPRLEVSYSSGSGSEDQIVGYRFQRVMVPKGATITSARLEFQAAQDDSNEADLVIKAQNIGDAPAFSSSSTDISGRTLTTASVAWEAVESWTAGQRYQSPDLTSVVQAVVNHADWCGGQAMAFVVSGESGSRRTAVAYDGDTSVAPTLHISYDPDSGNDGGCINQLFQAQVVSGGDDVEERSDTSIYTDSSDLELVQDGGTQTVGIRFRNVRIPKDTTIVSAELIFTVDETNSGDTSLTIKGEAADDSGAFSTSDGDVSNRDTTTASTSWGPDPWTTVGVTHASPDIGPIVQEIVNRAGWQDGNAMSFIITGTGERTAEAYEGNAAAAPVLRVYVQGALGTGYLTVRDKLVEITDGLNWKSGTPILDTLYEAARYWRGEGLHYGKTRGFGHDPDDGSFGESSRSRSEHTRLSHPASYLGGSIVRPDGCSENTPSSSACIDEYISGDPQYISPITEWCQTNYMILLSDGNGYGTQSVSLVNNIFDNDDFACSGHDDCSVNLASYLYRQDQHSLDQAQTVSTYTVGFNLDSTSPDFLTSVAEAGGGTFNTADTADELADVFSTILSDILSRTTSFTAPAVSVNAFNKLFHDSDVYFSLFLPERSVRWNGNLKKYTICAGEDNDNCTRGTILDANNPPQEALGPNNAFLDSSKSYWSQSNDGGRVEAGGAGENIPGHNTRVIYTYTGSTDPSNATLATPVNQITTDDASNAAGDALRVLLGADSLTDAAYSDLIYWILGMDVGDEDDDGSTTDQRWGFADPLHSQPLVLTYGKDSSDEPIKKIFIGTNDGAVRMVNSSTGVEEWAFIPQAMLEMQSQLKSNANGDHLYGMDGSLRAYIHDDDKDGIIEPPDDKVWLFATMRRGGRNVYALDVTPTDTITTGSATGAIVPKLKWRIEGGGSTGFGQLGQTWSSPQVVEIPYAGSSKHALVFGGGYHESQDSGFTTSAVGNAVYAVDITDGSLIWSVSGNGSGASVELSGMDYPIPSDLALMDSNGDYLVDRVYTGDLGGQVWRLDIQSSGSSSTVSGARLAILADNDNAADRRKFFYSPDVAQVYDADYSGNPEYDLLIMSSGNRADPTGTTVHNRVYGIRDYAITGSIASDFDAINESSDLYDATANLVQQGTDEEVTAAIEALKSKQGWYFDLSENGAWIGEKGLSSPIILDNRAFFTTYIPGANDNADDTCGSPVEGFGRLYAVDILNASAVYPNWDGVGDSSNYTKEDRDYDLWAGIPSSAVPIFQPEGVTLIVGGGGGGGTFDPDIELPVIRTFWLQPR